jgi:hypothetical protein
LEEFEKNIGNQPEKAKFQKNNLKNRFIPLCSVVRMRTSMHIDQNSFSLLNHAFRLFQNFVFDKKCQHSRMLNFHSTKERNETPGIIGSLCQLKYAHCASKQKS